MNFFASVCPLTGIPTKEMATFTPFNGSTQVLYTFKPIGEAIFDLKAALDITRLIEQGTHKPRPDLAGLCREAAEKEEVPPILSYKELFGEPRSDAPLSFDEKQFHLLRFLYNAGGQEHKKRNIFTYNDFPLAYAKDAQEMSQIMDSLIDEGWLTCANPDEDPNSWPGGIRTDYYGVLPTKEGKARVKELLEPVKAQVPKTVAQPQPLALATLHSAVQSAVGSRFIDGYYSDALHKACTALEKAVQDKANQPSEATGATLMSKVFSKDKPIIVVSSNQGEQEGYMFLYRGLTQAIRNHYAHNDPDTDANRALEWLSFISALFHKLDEARFQG